MNRLMARVGVEGDIPYEWDRRLFPRDEEISEVPSGTRWEFMERINELLYERVNEALIHGYKIPPCPQAERPSVST